jgi:uncharacterized protein (TIGR03086 family)
MTEIAQRYERIADAFTARVDAVPPGSWGAQSPCTDWTARDVVKHVVDTTRLFLTRLNGGDPTPPDTGEDVVASWRVESDAVKAALADPDKAGAKIKGLTGPTPFEDMIGTVLCADTLLHTWDLARATGQYDTLDPAAVESALAFLTPNDEQLRAPGGMGPKIEPPEDADEQTRLLCFTGRRP